MMKIELEHPARLLITQHAWEKLLANCRTFGAFSGRIERMASKIKKIPADQPNPYYLPGSGLDWANKFKGDIFEVFAELLIRLTPLDDRIGIHDYHVVTKNDTGVDGYGLSRDDFPTTVQIKYRQWDKILNTDESHLHNFRLTSRNRYRADTNRAGSMLFITCGKEVHWKTMAEFSPAMRCICLDTSDRCLRGSQPHSIDGLFSLKTIVNASVFWTAFRKQMGVS